MRTVHAWRTCMQYRYVDTCKRRFKPCQYAAVELQSFLTFDSSFRRFVVRASITKSAVNPGGNSPRTFTSASLALPLPADKMRSHARVWTCLCSSEAGTVVGGIVSRWVTQWTATPSTTRTQPPRRRSVPLTVAPRRRRAAGGRRAASSGVEPCVRRTCTASKNTRSSLVSLNNRRSAATAPTSSGRLTLRSSVCTFRTVSVTDSAEECKLCNAQLSAHLSYEPVCVRHA